VSEVGLIESRLKRATTSRRPDGIRLDCLADSRTEGRQASRRVFREGLKNESQGFVDQSVTARVKEETAQSVRASDVGALNNLGNFVVTERKRRNGGKPVGYSGRAALTRELCDRSSYSCVNRRRYNNRFKGIALWTRCFPGEETTCK
jgi:hypothetical protein